ncbi:MAG: metal-dependent transcriptional regulator [Thermomicrobiales bacterium]|nr:metal-dependent transcriptional regulator [Thermomicrobiales bacterium]MCO5217759.1 metal-dependent transcriptional regulator [Thermomicrobiales bacterium]
MEDYLKAIYRLQSTDEPVTNQQLADELGFSGASITNMHKRLHELNLLVLEPYKGVRLTSTGTAVALEVIRHHRLLELYLAQTLGMDLDAVHEEADRLEHHVSEELEARIAAALGYPEFDPHGDPIPSVQLTISELEDQALVDSLNEIPLVVTRVGDRIPQTVRGLVATGILPGAVLTNVETAGQEGLIVSIDDGRVVAITLEQAGAVRVQPLDAR